MIYLKPAKAGFFVLAGAGRAREGEMAAGEGEGASGYRPAVGPGGPRDYDNGIWKYDGGISHNTIVISPYQRHTMRALPPSLPPSPSPSPKAAGIGEFLGGFAKTAYNQFSARPNGVTPPHRKKSNGGAIRAGKRHPHIPPSPHISPHPIPRNSSTAPQQPLNSPPTAPQQPAGAHPGADARPMRGRCEADVSQW